MMALAQNASVHEGLEEKAMVMAFLGVSLCFWLVVQKTVSWAVLVADIGRC